MKIKIHAYLDKIYGFFKTLLKDHASWIFDGIGTTFLAALIPLLVGVIFISHDSTEYVQDTPAPNGQISSPAEKFLMTRDSFKQAIEKTSGKSCIYDYYGDYDNDGDCEMYALVGIIVPEDNEFQGGNLVGSLWFADMDGAFEMSSEDIEYWPYPYVITLNDRLFLALEKYYATGSLTYLWGVYENYPYETNLSARANGFLRNDFGELEVIDSTYDAGYFYADDGEKIETGHTWKHYYFYFDGKNFKEYGGIYISEEDFRRIVGADELIKYMADNPKSIIYRSNGIININWESIYEDGGGFFNLTLRIVNGKLGILSHDLTDNPYELTYDIQKFIDHPDDYYGDGYFLRAMRDDIAVYPNSYPY